MRHAALATLALALVASAARAQDDSYRPPAHVGEDAVALAFIAGRYTSPVTCKKRDGSTLDVQDSIVLKLAPEEGEDTLRVTFFGIGVKDVDYCYNLLERRVRDRRGTILLHYRSYNRKDLGVSDFRRAAAAGPLVYNAHRGELTERGVGADPGTTGPRTLAFDGGDSRLVLESIAPGTDGAKLLASYDPNRGLTAGDPARRFAFHFFAKDGSDFVVYGVEDVRKRPR